MPNSPLFYEQLCWQRGLNSMSTTNNPTSFPSLIYLLLHSSLMHSLYESKEYRPSVEISTRRRNHSYRMRQCTWTEDSTALTNRSSRQSVCACADKTGRLISSHRPDYQQNWQPNHWMRHERILRSAFRRRNVLKLAPFVIFSLFSPLTNWQWVILVPRWQNRFANMGRKTDHLPFLLPNSCFSVPRITFLLIYDGGKSWPSERRL